MNVNLTSKSMIKTFSRMDSTLNNSLYEVINDSDYLSIGNIITTFRSLTKNKIFLEKGTMLGTKVEIYKCKKIKNTIKHKNNISNEEGIIRLYYKDFEIGRVNKHYENLLYNLLYCYDIICIITINCDIKGIIQFNDYDINIKLYLKLTVFKDFSFNKEFDMIDKHKLYQIMCSTVENKKDINKEINNEFNFIYNNDYSKYNIINNLELFDNFDNICKRELYPHQKSAYKWMSNIENNYYFKENPLYDKFSFKFELFNVEYNRENSIKEILKERFFNNFVLTESINNDIDIIDIYFNIETKDIQLKSPDDINTAKGGILADEMGLGKTSTALTLILNDNDTIQNTHLIITTPSLINHWESEIIDIFIDNYIIIKDTNSNPLTFKNFINLTKNIDINIKRIVISTYGTVLHRFDNNKFIYKQIDFKRIILDEAHLISQTKTATFKKIFNLKSKYLWIVTGTPIQNSIEDLKSYFILLNYYPLNNETFWKIYYNSRNPLKNNTSVQIGSYQLLEKIREVLNYIMIRRTKELHNDILKIPNKHIENVYITLTKEELKEYNAILSECKDNFLKSNKLSNHIFYLLMRLRQCCNSIHIINEKEGKNNEDITEIIKKFANNYKFENEDYVTTQINKIINNEVICPICHDVPFNLILLKCLHYACKECLRLWFDSKHACMVCKESLNIIKDIVKIPKLKKDVTVSDIPSSTKISSIIDELKEIKHTDKIVIFSHFRKMLDILEQNINSIGIKVVKIDGKTKNRNEEFNIFKENDNYRVLLITYKIGGIGLNFVNANHVFLVDHWWNPSIEKQAIDRVHRIGQNKEVFIKRFITKNTIEEKLIETNKNKELLQRYSYGSDLNYDELYQYLKSKIISIN